MFGDLVVNLVARVNQFTAPMAAARRALVSFGQATASAAAGVGRAMASVSGSIANAVSGMASSLGGLGMRVLTGVTGQLTAFAATAGAAFSLTKAASWGVEQAVQAEKAKIGLEVMLGSQAKAVALFDQLVDYGRMTGYGAGAQQAAETLIQYRIPLEQVLPSLKALGDIARGDKEKLHSLTLAFGQANAAGRLMGQEALQFINAGFSPLAYHANKMAEQFGGLASDYMPALKKQMEEGQFSFAMVQEAIMGATGAGGQFEDMMLRIAETVGGQWNILESNVGLVLRTMAEGFMAGFDVTDYFALANIELSSMLSNSGAIFEVFKALGSYVRSLFDELPGKIEEVIDKLGAGGILDEYKQMFQFLGILQEGLNLRDKAGLGPGAGQQPKDWMGPIKTEIELTPEGMKEWKEDLLFEQKTGQSPEQVKKNLDKAQQAANREKAGLGPLFFDENDPNNAAWQFAQQTGKTAEDVALDKRRAKFEQKQAADEARKIMNERHKKDREWNALTPQQKLDLIAQKPWMALGREEEIEEIKQKIADKELKKKPEKTESIKTSGALAAGSREAYSAIVAAMAQRGEQTMQKQQLRVMQRQVDVAEKQVEVQVAMRDDIRRNKIGVVENLA